jgi:hypothetical protein
MQTALLVGVIAAALLAGSPHAAATTESIPLSLTQSVPCANGGAGELVELTGRLGIVQAATFDAAGGAHLYVHVNPQGVSGTGLSTGTSYRGVGVTVQQLNLGFGAEQVIVSNFLVIGAGSTPDLRVHETLVVVVSANGFLTARVTNVRVTCA